MLRPYKQTRSLTRVVNAHGSAEGRDRNYILRNIMEGIYATACETLAAHGESPSPRKVGTVTDFRRLPHIGDIEVAGAKIVDSPHFSLCTTFATGW